MRGVMIINSIHRARVPGRWLETLQREHEFAVTYTAFPHHARYLAEEAAQRGVEAVLVVGGDGTVNDAVNGLAGSDTSLAVWPVGTANDFASQFGIGSRRASGLEMLDHHAIQAIDLVRVNGWHFATVGGLGLPCDVLRQRDKLRDSRSVGGWLCRKAGKYAYLQALCSILRTSLRSHGLVRVETLRESFTCEPVSLLVANQPVVGHAFKVAPQASNTDGVCDLFIIDRSRQVLTTLRAVGQTVCSILGEPESVIRLQAEHIRLISERVMSFFGDGEVATSGRVFDIQVVPQALRVLVPHRPVTDSGFPRRYSANHRRLRGLVAPTPVSSYSIKR